MGFVQISAETRGEIVKLYNERKTQKFIADEIGTFRTGVHRVLKRCRGSGESKRQPQAGRKRKSSK